jgi:quercetin dioxygenase-like cupin family protein
MTSPLDLSSTFVVIEPDHAAVPVTVSATLYDELDARFDGFKGRLLVSTHDFDQDWPTWEMHPAGDEIVSLLRGESRLILERESGQEVIHLQHPGAFAIVPKGIWHTARTSVSTRMLFVTPGEGTQNRPIG